jgi:hypothetical protein
MNTDPNTENQLHNPAFNVTQRGTGPWTTTGYTADRWALATSGDTVSASLVTATDADRAAIGRWEAEKVMQIAVTGNAAATSYTLLRQGIEQVRFFSYYTLTISFYAKATSGAPSVGASFDQNFGTSGSATSAGTGSSVALTTTWTRYSLTLLVPSCTGKTIGASDYLQANLWFSSGANNAPRSAIGVQSATIQIWGVQVEKYSSASTLKIPTAFNDYLHARRFYRLLPFQTGAASGLSVTVYITVTFGSPMRSNPTITYTGSTSTNCSNPSTVSTSQEAVVISTSAGIGSYSLVSTIVASCDF